MDQEEAQGKQIMIDNLPSHARVCINVFLIQDLNQSKNIKN
jgi:hypothetical protein